VAVVVGYIAYRQWRTARDKLKSDLFDKRLALYTSAFATINAITRIQIPTLEDLIEHERGMAGARWLFNEKVEKHLSQLATQARKRLVETPYEPSGVTDGDKFIEAAKLFQERQAARNRLLAELDVLTNPFLSLRH
jgi:hypothetical protein